MQTNNEDSESNSNNIVASDIADVLGIEYNEEDNMSLILGDGLADYNIVLISNEDEEELESKYNGISELKSAKLDEYTVVDLSVSVDADIETEGSTTLVTTQSLKSYSGPGSENEVVNEYGQNIKLSVTTVEKDGYVLLDNSSYDEWVEKDLLCTQEEYTKSLQGCALLDISDPDTSYNGQSVALTAEDRDLLERLVMGEAGGQGYEGAALVAQCIRDTMVYKGFDSVAAVRASCKYSGSISKTPNQNVLDAVAFIFDEGGYAVRHKVFYFYAFNSCTSSWHESRPFVIQYGGHRFFA